MKTFILLVGAATVVCATLSGCQFNVHTGGNPSVAKADIEKTITEKLTTGDQKPQSVSCPEDLTAEVGKSTTCDVVLNDDEFQTTATVTKLDGETASYDMSPSLSKAQVEKRVNVFLTGNNWQIDSVACDSGLEGKTGTSVHCQVTPSDGEPPFGETVTMGDIRGLAMDLNFKGD